MTEPYTNMEIEPVPIEERRAEASTQLGVDEAILDYLTYKATKAVLRDFQKSTNASARDIKKPQRTVHLDLVDCESFTYIQPLSSRIFLTRLAQPSLSFFVPYMEAIKVLRSYNFACGFSDLLRCSRPANP